MRYGNVDGIHNIKRSRPQSSPLPRRALRDRGAQERVSATPAAARLTPSEGPHWNNCRTRLLSEAEIDLTELYVCLLVCIYRDAQSPKSGLIQNLIESG